MNALILAVALAATSATPENDGPLLTLDAALAQAKSNNLDLQIAQQKVEQAQLLSRKVWSAYLPQVTVSGQYIRNNAAAELPFATGYYIRDLCGAYGGPSSPAYQGCAAQVGGPAYDPSRDPGVDNPPGAPSGYALVPSALLTVEIQKLNTWGGAVTLNQAVIAPALWPAISNAYLAEKMAELSVDNARREVLYFVAQLYYGAATLKEATRVQRQQLDVNRKHEADAKVRYDSGAIPKAALLRAEIDRSRSEQDVKRFELTYQAAKVALSTVLDRDAAFTVELPKPIELPADLDKLEETSLRDRPDVETARVSVSLANGQHTGALMQYLPNVGLIGKYQLSNTTGFTGKNDSWYVGLGLQWTIFDGLARETALAETSSKIVEAELGLRAKVRSAQDEVTRAKLDLETAFTNREKSVEQLRLARENAQLMAVTFDSGAATYLEVEDAKTQLLQAELGNVNEQLNANLAVLKVLKASGRFNP